MHITDNDRLVNIADNVKSFFSLPSLADVLWLDEPSSSTQSGSVQVMDRASRNELVKTVEGLREQLQQYKIKLRGTVPTVCRCLNIFFFHHHHHHHLSLNCEGRWDTTDDFTTNFLPFSLSSTALWDLPNSRPAHSLMSFHLFLYLPCLLPPFTVPCKMVLVRPDERETWLYHCSLRLFTIVRRSSCGPIAWWIVDRIFFSLMNEKKKEAFWYHF